MLPTGIAAGTDATATVTIIDDDKPTALTVEFAAAGYTVAEGSTVTVTVTLSDDPEQQVVVPVAAMNSGGASAGDYMVSATMLTFNDGDTSKTLTVTATDDITDDDGESVELSFGTLPTSPVTVTAGTIDETTVTITDNDTAGIDVSVASLRVDEGDSSGSPTR